MMKELKENLKPLADDLIEAEMASGQSIQSLQENAVVEARKSMNAIQIVSPAIQKVMTLEGKEQQECFSKILEESDRVSRLVLSQWGHDPKKRENRWMINVIEKSIMPDINPEKPLSPDTIKSLAKNLSLRAYEKKSLDGWMDEDSISLTFFTGMNKLLKSQSKFDFGRKKTLDKDLEDLREIITKTSLNILNQLCPSITPHPDRVVFVNIILTQCFDLMCASWDKNAVIASNALKNLSNEQLKSWKSSKPNGFGIDPVIKEFEKNTSRLLRLTAITLKKK